MQRSLFTAGLSFIGAALILTSIHIDRSVQAAPLMHSNRPTLPLGAAVDPQIPTTLIDPNSDKNLTVGAGFDSTTGVVKPSCIRQTSKDLSPPETDGQSDGLHFTRIDSLDDEESALDVDAHASYGIGIFGADAAVKYLSTSTINSYESYLLINEPIENAKQLLSTYSLNRSGRDALKAGILNFISVCGDQYVSGQVTGGKLQAMLHIVSKTEDEKTSADATLNASGWGASMSVAVEQQLQALKDSGRLQADIIRQGPSESWPHATVKDLIDYAESLPPRVHCTGKEPADSPCPAWITSYIVADYREVLGHWNLPAQQADFFQRESVYLKSLYHALADFTYVASSEQADPDGEFGPIDPLILQRDIDALNAEISNVQDKARNCARDVTMCASLQHITIPDAPPRAHPWITVDPTYNTPRLYESVVGGNGAILEMRGHWLTQCQNRAAGIFGPGDVAVVRLVDRLTGAAGNTRYTHPIPILPNYDIYWYTEDAVPGDNCPDPTDPVRLRVSTLVQ